MNKGRVLIIVFLMIVFCSILLIRLFKIQINDHDDLIYYARRQQIKEKEVRAERGFIYDRNNNLLAYDRNDVSYFINCKKIKKEEIQKVAIIKI
jgi:cell division protein FtsI/penicillin-binding protein 2